MYPDTRTAVSSEFSIFFKKKKKKKKKYWYSRILLAVLHVHEGKI
eukprot:SAG11_NODE_1056_length_6009_cov_30.238877_6_plen_45_part_00